MIGNLSTTISEMDVAAAVGISMTIITMTTATIIIAVSNRLPLQDLIGG